MATGGGVCGRRYDRTRCRVSVLLMLFLLRDFRGASSRSSESEDEDEDSSVEFHSSSQLSSTSSSSAVGAGFLESWSAVGRQAPRTPERLKVLAALADETARDRETGEGAGRARGGTYPQSVRT